MAIHDHSRGIPRTINVICNNALISGFARGERPVGEKVALEVCDHLDLSSEVLAARERTSFADGQMNGTEREAKTTPLL